MKQVIIKDTKNDDKYVCDDFYKADDEEPFAPGHDRVSKNLRVDKIKITNYPSFAVDDRSS